jgi:hypothetical protein
MNPPVIVLLAFGAAALMAGISSYPQIGCRSAREPATAAVGR